MLFTYLARAARDPDEANRLAGIALDLLAAAADPPGVPTALHGGMVGLAWAMTHVGHALSVAAPVAACDELDTALLARVRERAWPGEHDLLTGLTGIGVYGLERCGSSRLAGDLVAAVVQQLADTAHVRAPGIAWHTPSARLPLARRAELSRGAYDLGLAHGVPGVIAFLAGACRAGIASEAAGALLAAAVDWTLAQQLAAGPGARYPAWIAADEPPWPARLAWCTGGLGVATALLVAARCVAEPHWERAAIRLAELEAARDPRQTRVVDACLCHGASGNAHLFHRLYRATGRPVLAAAARRWFEHTLDSHDPARGDSGFRFWAPDPAAPTPAPTWTDDRSLMTGSTGVALALVAAITADAPAWDRLLLASVAGSGHDASGR